MEAQLIIPAGATLGEGPCWDEKKQVLYWIDILEKKIHRFKPVTNETQTIKLSQYIGCLGLVERGGYLVGLQDGIYYLDEISEEIVSINHPESEKKENRFNDGKVDPGGRFWAGTMHLDGLEGEGALYRLDIDKNISRMIEDVSISNGLAWDTNKQLMYYIDTPTKKVAAFDYDAATGEINNKRYVITIPEGEGFPDGMTIDAEGMLWIAHWGGSRVSRWNPDNGEKLSEIFFPVSQVTCCCFGGEKLDKLYVTTASVGLSEAEQKEQPNAGGVFVVEPGVKGTYSYRFKG
ncbi:SMP-30/gluconolactonase/LRE family protein [Evansella cellulosilytica]|uniref:SMP-30/Gluconolaconase/LRE-like region-containing protein n=1 Tax=Evansella cellulosilytica (strain ATCC 21833 / DSM 2522 / FERM P-1141 / JCM 9156 / N-4) TaxID=649639 RepID=E6TQT0_EVAC2|nr:SMP-30/gluconolactonase/LRE family protein [Evansella cellulosilytica]ADU31705.1 SMP-30/Gluconolaconase/LRE-like region-containing protein [Evansella cellulosilytica DSM 2522]